MESSEFSDSKATSFIVLDSQEESQIAGERTLLTSLPGLRMEKERCGHSSEGNKRSSRREAAGRFLCGEREDLEESSDEEGEQVLQFPLFHVTDTGSEAEPFIVPPSPKARVTVAETETQSDTNSEMLSDAPVTMVMGGGTRLTDKFSSSDDGEKTLVAKQIIDLSDDDNSITQPDSSKRSSGRYKLGSGVECEISHTQNTWMTRKQRTGARSPSDEIQLLTSQGQLIHERVSLEEEEGRVRTPSEHLGSLQPSQDVVPDTIEGESLSCVPPSQEAYGSCPVIIPSSPTDRSSLDSDAEHITYKPEELSTLETNGKHSKRTVIKESMSESRSSSRSDKQSTDTNGNSKESLQQAQPFDLYSDLQTLREDHRGKHRHRSGEGNGSRKTKFHIDIEASEVLKKRSGSSKFIASLSEDSNGDSESLRLHYSTSHTEEDKPTTTEQGTSQLLEEQKVETDNQEVQDSQHIGLHLSPSQPDTTHGGFHLLAPKGHTALVPCGPADSSSPDDEDLIASPEHLSSTPDEQALKHISGAAPGLKPSLSLSMINTQPDEEDSSVHSFRITRPAVAEVSGESEEANVFKKGLSPRKGRKRVLYDDNTEDDLSCYSRQPAPGKGSRHKIRIDHVVSLDTRQTDILLLSQQGHGTQEDGTSHVGAVEGRVSVEQSSQDEASQEGALDKPDYEASQSALDLTKDLEDEPDVTIPLKEVCQMEQPVLHTSQGKIINASGPREVDTITVPHEEYQGTKEAHSDQNTIPYTVEAFTGIRPRSAPPMETHQSSLPADSWQGSRGRSTPERSQLSVESCSTSQHQAKYPRQQQTPTTESASGNLNPAKHSSQRQTLMKAPSQSQNPAKPQQTLTRPPGQRQNPAKPPSQRETPEPSGPPGPKQVTEPADLYEFHGSQSQCVQDPEIKDPNETLIMANPKTNPSRGGKQQRTRIGAAAGVRQYKKVSVTRGKKTAQIPSPSSSEEGLKCGRGGRQPRRENAGFVGHSSILKEAAGARGKRALKTVRLSVGSTGVQEKAARQVPVLTGPSTSRESSVPIHVFPVPSITASPSVLPLNVSGASDKGGSQSTVRQRKIVTRRKTVTYIQRHITIQDWKDGKLIFTDTREETEEPIVEKESVTTHEESEYLSPGPSPSRSGSTMTSGDLGDISSSLSRSSSHSSKPSSGSSFERTHSSLEKLPSVGSECVVQQARFVGEDSRFVSPESLVPPVYRTGSATRGEGRPVLKSHSSAEGSDVLFTTPEQEKIARSGVGADHFVAPGDVEHSEDKAGTSSRSHGGRPRSKDRSSGEGSAVLFTSPELEKTDNLSKSTHKSLDDSRTELSPILDEDEAAAVTEATLIEKQPADSSDDNRISGGKSPVVTVSPDISSSSATEKQVIISGGFEVADSVCSAKEGRQSDSHNFTKLLHLRQTGSKSKLQKSSNSPDSSEDIPLKKTRKDLDEETSTGKRGKGSSKGKGKGKTTKKLRAKSAESGNADDISPEIPLQGPINPEAVSTRAAYSRASATSLEGQTGAPVMARWKDGYYYPGQLAGLKANDRCQIRFDDGDNLTVKLYDVILADRLTIGQSVLVESSDGGFDPGLVIGYYGMDTDTGYTVERDDGKTQKYPRGKVILSADQATCIMGESAPPISPAHQIIRVADVSLDNIVENRIRLKTGSAAKSDPAGSSVKGKKRKAAIFEPTTTSTPTPKNRRRGQSEATTTPVQGMIGGATDSPKAGRRTSRKVRTGLFDDAKGPLPDSSTLFRGMIFLLTHTDKTESQRQEEKKLLQESSFEASTDESAIEDEVVVPFDKDHLKSQIEAGGGFVMEHFNMAQVSASRQCYLISDSYQRTIKYLQCLAANIPCVSHVWIRDSCKQGELLETTSYVLPAGLNIESRKVKECKKGHPLIGLAVSVVSEVSAFREVWSSILETSGCVINTALPSDVTVDTDLGVVVTDSTCLKSFIGKSEKAGVPVVAPEWVIQCLIRGENLHTDSHPRYRPDYTDD